MDNNCAFCGEPWEFWSIEEFSLEEDGGTKKDFWNGKGCPCCHWGKDTEKKLEQSDDRAAMFRAMSDILGDDEDGLAAMLEDFDFLED